MPNSENSKARPDQIRALDRRRRGAHVTLHMLADRFTHRTAWLSRALRGEIPMTRGQVRELRGLVEELAPGARR